jgi:hypothetical protein
VSDLLGSRGRCETRIGESGGDIEAIGLPCWHLRPSSAAKGPCACIKDAGKWLPCARRSYGLGESEPVRLLSHRCGRKAMVCVRDWADVRSGGCCKPSPR